MHPMKDSSATIRNYSAYSTSHLISLSAVKNRGYYNILLINYVVAAVSLHSKAPKAMINRGQ